jgi:trehalose-phosphatase
LKFLTETALIQWARQDGRLWLFLDYDGTLADYAPTPAYVEPNPRIISLLERLARKSTLRITILSGRRLQDIRRILPIQEIFLAGTYGIEFLTPEGEIIQRIKYDEIRPFLETVKPRWEYLISGKHGFFLEDKGWTLAIHARFAYDQEAELVIAQARDTAMPKSLPNVLRILQGHKFLEIAPILANKGEAVTYFLNQYPFPDARLLYFGDDAHDEEAFSVIHANHGVAIKVLQPTQESSTSADLCLESPNDALYLLEQLI